MALDTTTGLWAVGGMADWVHGELGAGQVGSMPSAALLWRDERWLKLASHGYARPCPSSEPVQSLPALRHPWL